MNDITPPKPAQPVTPSPPVLAQPTGPVQTNTPKTNVGKPIRRHRLLKMLGVLLLLGAIAAGVYYYLDSQPKVIKIGDVTLTKQAVADYAAAIDSYKAARPELDFGASSEKVALDDLVMNAALKKEAKAVNDPAVEATVKEATAIQYDTAENIKQVIQTRAANEAYKKALAAKLIAKKDLFYVSIPYDAPYYSDKPADEVSKLFQQSLDRLGKEFTPLFKQKASRQTIAAKVDVNFDDSDKADDADPTPYYNGLVTNAKYRQNYAPRAKGMERDPGTTGFNDIDRSIYFGVTIKNLQNTDAKIATLKNVGDYTEPFASKAGVFMIVRLEGKSGGPYDSWASMLDQYKSKYVAGKKLTDAANSLASGFDRAAKVVGDVVASNFQPEAAVAAGCSSAHNIVFALYSIDTTINAAITKPGAKFSYTRNGSPGCNAANSISSGYHEGQTPKLIPDNCWNPEVSWGIVSTDIDGYEYTGFSGFPAWNSAEVNMADQAVPEVKFYYKKLPPPPAGTVTVRKVGYSGTDAVLRNGSQTSTDTSFTRSYNTDKLYVDTSVVVPSGATFQRSTAVYSGYCDGHAAGTENSTSNALDVKSCLGKSVVVTYYFGTTSSEGTVTVQKVGYSGTDAVLRNGSQTSTGMSFTRSYNTDNLYVDTSVSVPSGVAFQRSTAVYSGPCYGHVAGTENSTSNALDVRSCLGKTVVVTYYFGSTPPASCTFFNGNAAVKGGDSYELSWGVNSSGVTATLEGIDDRGFVTYTKSNLDLGAWIPGVGYQGTKSFTAPPPPPNSIQYQITLYTDGVAVGACTSTINFYGPNPVCDNFKYTLQPQTIVGERRRAVVNLQFRNGANTLTYPTTKVLYRVNWPAWAGGATTDEADAGMYGNWVNFGSTPGPTLNPGSTGITKTNIQEPVARPTGATDPTFTFRVTGVKPGGGDLVCPEVPPAPAYGPWLQTRRGNVLSLGDIKGQVPDKKGSRPATATELEAQYVVIGYTVTNFCSTKKYGLGGTCTYGEGYQANVDKTAFGNLARDPVIKGIKKTLMDSTLSAGPCTAKKPYLKIDYTDIVTGLNLASDTCQVIMKPTVDAAVTITGTNIRKGSGTLYVVGNVIITGDINADYSGPYGSIKLVPNLGIIATGDIIIKPGVKNIDVSLYAFGKVKTCDGYPSATCGDNALRIRGKLAAGKGFDLGRNNFQSTSGPSSTPAELVVSSGLVDAFPPPGFVDLFSATARSIRIISTDSNPRF